MRHRSLGAAVMATAMLGLACQSSAQTPAPPATPPAAPAAPAAPPPSAHKQELLNKLAEVANVRGNATQGFQALMGNLSASFSGVARQVVGASQVVAPADRQATIDRIVAARDRVVKQIGDRIAQRVDYPQMSVDTYMRLYDKLFTEQELSDLPHVLSDADRQEADEQCPADARRVGTGAGTVADGHQAGGRRSDEGRDRRRSPEDGAAQAGHATTARV